MSTTATPTADHPTRTDAVFTGPTSTDPARARQPAASTSTPTPRSDTTTARPNKPARAVTHQIPVKGLAILAAAAVVFSLAHLFTGLFIVLAVLAAVGAVVGIGVIALIASLPWLLAALGAIALLAAIASMPWWLFVALVVITLAAFTAQNLRQHSAYA